MTTTPAISTEHLRRMFAGGVGLEDLSITTDPGEVLVLLGPNGAGKTTTVRLLNGVLRAEAGSARVLGIDPGINGDELRRRTGVLTENPGLDDRLTTFENLWYAARIRGLGKRETKPRIESMLEEFGMADRRDSPVQGMSTGQRKRIALIRALIHEPELLFLDEPTSGLDPSATRAVLDLIAGLAHRGATIVLCTHFLGEAGRLADRAAILERGKVLAFGRPHELAAELWPGIGLALDLGRRVDPATLAFLQSFPGVIGAQGNEFGAQLRIDARDRVPQLVQELVQRSVPLFGATMQPDTLEQVYFEIEQRSIGARAAQEVAA